MDVKLINPVLQAFANILPQIGFQQNIEKKGLSLIGSTLTNPGLLLTISIVGPLKGTVLIGMTLEAAKQFASKMMMGMPVAELDPLAQSAISEMGNMVCANSCTNFAEAGIGGLDISPPTMMIGEGGHVMLSVPNVIMVKFSIDNIDVDVYVGLIK
ncbi:chemotaxis protein CheX [Propionispora hippei]|uniref:Chemotaxis protein CheX n=1 Tax=Propionispora hippei DSM 15287 TaxID=1123003 RepID=A0A1M6J952_9FIRM|nr:chemotaxis protein CheX [Propionispora hippei]SHJ43238.1 chemotaxis protein CheX [Propionispora hippei DSM 15287]